MSKKDKSSPRRDYTTASISFDAELLALAKARADSLGMTFSEYVCRCLDKETSDGGDFVIRPKNTKGSDDKW